MNDGDINYSFGTSGHNWNQSVRSGGVLGANITGTYWGALGYKNSAGNTYGAYYTSGTSGSGKSGIRAGIGLGSYSEQIGGWFMGDRYGLYLSGDNFSSYSQGNSFISGFQAFPQYVNGAVVVPFALSSSSVDVITHGVGKLTGGHARLSFSQEFTVQLADGHDIIVTCTPCDTMTDVALSLIDHDGFDVTGDSKTGAASFMWLAIGRKKGFENTIIPDALDTSDFERTMNTITVNEMNQDLDSVITNRDDDYVDTEYQNELRDDESRWQGRESHTPVVTNPTTSTDMFEPDTGFGPHCRLGREQVDIGEVLTSDSQHPGFCHPCSEYNDSTVLGIAIDTTTRQPLGIIKSAVNEESTARINDAIGFKSQKKNESHSPDVLLAETGSVVLCKVDATFGPILIGDLLTTSPTPGHAMKDSSNRFGSTVIIAKALEPLPEGKGLITVLVLQ